MDTGAMYQCNYTSVLAYNWCLALTAEDPSPLFLTYTTFLMCWGIYCTLQTWAHSVYRLQRFNSIYKSYVSNCSMLLNQVIALLVSPIAGLCQQLCCYIREVTNCSFHLSSNTQQNRPVNITCLYTWQGPRKALVKLAIWQVLILKLWCMEMFFSKITVCYILGFSISFTLFLIL